MQQRGKHLLQKPGTRMQYHSAPFFCELLNLGCPEFEGQAPPVRALDDERTGEKHADGPVGVGLNHEVQVGDLGNRNKAVAVKVYDLEAGTERIPAFTAVDRAIAVDPRYAEGHCLRGDIAVVLNDRITAIESYECAVGCGAPPEDAVFAVDFDCYGSYPAGRLADLHASALRGEAART